MKRVHYRLLGQLIVPSFSFSRKLSTQASNNLDKSRVIKLSISLAMVIAAFFILGLFQYVFCNDVDVWAFRTDNRNNSEVKASIKILSGRTEDSYRLDDFTLCVRYRILYFNTNGDGINIITQGISSWRQTNIFHLKVYDDKWPNLLTVNYADGRSLMMWFEAEVPPRQWNTMCIVHDRPNNKLKIFQNNDLVYSFGGTLN